MLQRNDKGEEKTLKIALYTLGCKVNQYETQAMEQELLRRGHTLVPFEEAADAYIINTCTVTAVSDKKSRNAIRRAKKRNENAVVGVCGCYAQVAPEELHALETQFPQLSGIMIGRGFIADPALLRRARGGTGASREELRGYLDDLYHGYTELFGSAGCAVSRMKAHWFYLIHRFAGSEKLEKQLRKAREPWEYEVLVNQIFTLPML